MYFLAQSKGKAWIQKISDLIDHLQVAEDLEFMSSEMYVIPHGSHPACSGFILLNDLL